MPYCSTHRFLLKEWRKFAEMNFDLIFLTTITLHIQAFKTVLHIKLKIFFPNPILKSESLKKWHESYLT